MKYFSNCHTIEELKTEYKKRIKELHPDLNKDRDTTKEFQEMQNEYNITFDKVKNIHKNVNGEMYEQETEETPQEFMDIINKLIILDGVNVELIGSWIWLTGNTFAYKKQIKELGFRWCNNKKAWSFHFGDWVKKRSKKTLEEIKEIYGVKKIDNVKVFKLGDVKS